MGFSIVMSYPFFNVISIFTSGFLLYWFLCAINRFFEVIALRLVILTDRLVYIRGLNSYIRTFSEMTSQSHINAIIHTRQSNPPIEVNTLKIPIIINSATLLKQINDRVIDINVTLLTKSYLYIFIDFNNDTFKNLLSESNIENTTNTRSSNSVTPLIITLSSLLNDLSKYPSDNNFQKFIELGICSNVYSAGSIRDTKNHKVTLTCPNNQLRFNSSNSNALDSTVQSIALLVISEDSNLQSSLISSKSILSLRDTSIEFVSVQDDETSSPNNIEFMNPMSNDISKTAVSSNQYDIFKLGIFTLTGSAGSDISSSRIELKPQDNYINTKNGSLYTIQEIFGLKSQSNSNNIVINKPSSVSQINSNNKLNNLSVDRLSEGRGIEDECVVCLTEKKTIAFLPCRHLCVCQNCLTHIDKCPVCRTNFDEYLLLQPSAKILNIKVSS